MSVRNYLIAFGAYTAGAVSVVMGTPEPQSFQPTDFKHIIVRQPAADGQPARTRWLEIEYVLDSKADSDKGHAKPAVDRWILFTSWFGRVVTFTAKEVPPPK